MYISPAPRCQSHGPAAPSLPMMNTCRLYEIQRLVAGERAGPRAGRLDDHARLDRAARGDHAMRLDPLDAGRDLEPRARDELAQQRGDINHAVARDVQRARDPQLVDRPGVQHARAIADVDVHAEPLRARDVAIRDRGVVEAEDAAGRRPHAAHLAQQLSAAHGQRGRRLVLGELAAEPGRTPAREPAQRSLALEHDDVTDARLAARPRPWLRPQILRR